MRHYLNDKLKGDIDLDGNRCYPIYFMFSVNRQTFKIKSRILNKPYSQKSFEALLNSDNFFLSKDREIISYCIDQSTSGGFIDINEFKQLYSKNCTSLYFWLSEHARSPGQVHMDDFMFGREKENQVQQSLRSLEEVMHIDSYTVLSYFRSFYEYKKQENDFEMYLLVYDWERDLDGIFLNFIIRKYGRIPVPHENLMPFINNLIDLI